MNSLNYRRLNVLSTLFDNVPKAKMLKEESKDWDTEDNSLLFGEKFKEELQKDSTAKGKDQRFIHWAEESIRIWRKQLNS